MKNIFTTHFLLVPLAFAPSSYAEYTEYGSGVSSCGSWVNDRKTPSNWHQNGQWVNGFISAAGYYGENLKEVDADALLVFMDNYCQQHPLNKISDGAKALLDELVLK